MHSQDSFDYFENQQNRPYESTKSFFTFLSKSVDLKSCGLIVDACCGSGAASIYLRDCGFTNPLVAFDKSEAPLKLLQSKLSSEEKYSNIKLLKENVDELSEYILGLKSDGIILLQVLSFLDNWQESLEKLSNVSHKWIAGSSLFFSGRMSASNRLIIYGKDFSEVTPNDYDCSNQYNVISIPQFKFFLSKLGYKKIEFAEFKFPTSLKAKDSNLPSSYTRKMHDGENLLFTGPLYLPWYNFIAIR